MGPLVAEGREKNFIVLLLKFTMISYILRTLGGDMQNTYTAIVKNDGDWWIGWIEEIPGVNCQERTKDELMETLKITLKEALEFNRLDALEYAKSEYYEEMVQI
jgi:predicted RNase H-like HicB family nuclease